METDADVMGQPESHEGRSGWVVGVDGSDVAMAAARWAAEHVADRSDQLRLLSVWNLPNEYLYPPFGSLIDADEEHPAQRSAKSNVNKAAVEIGEIPGVSLDRYIGRGGSSEVLLEYAQEAELVVVGARGHGGFKRLLLGSTSTQCATHAQVPTVVVPGPVEPVTSEQIVVGFDGSENSVAALEWALGFAREGDSVECITVLESSVVSIRGDHFLVPEQNDEVKNLVSARFDKTLAEFGQTEARVTHDFVEGPSRQLLTDFGEEASLLVLGTRGLGPIRTALLGSVSSWLLHHAKVPMVVVPPHNEANA